MNIKSLRRNYDGLTTLERLALADNAEARDDETEIRAINAASPKESYRQVDFYDLMQQINTFRLCNLITRFGYLMMFDYFVQTEDGRPDEHGERLDAARMSAFLFCRTKDAWQMVSDELGLRPDFDGEISELLFSFDLLARKEAVMRRAAFSEDEATDYLKRKYGEGKAKTAEAEADAIREALGLRNR